MGALSKLQAVNRMLRAASELPVNSLDTSGVSDTDVAISILEERSISLQIEGKYWNTETQTLLPDLDGKIALASNVLNVIPVNEWANRNITMRAGFAYDIDENSNVFSDDTDGIDFQVVYNLPFADIPTYAQFLIADSAAREYQARVVGDANVDQNLQVFEIQSLIRSKREEAKARRASWIGKRTSRSIHDRENDNF